MFNRLPLLALLVASLAIVPTVAPRADDSAHVGAEDLDNDSDYDRARDLLEHGEINPLREIMSRLSGEHPGEIVGISLAQVQDRWVYKFKIFSADGSLQEFSVDAKSMDVIHEGGD